MYVWVNSRGGWVIHGRARKSEGRAREVAELLRRRKGWETMASVEKPVHRSPRDGAPGVEEATRSPVSFD